MDISKLITSDDQLKVIDEGVWVGDFADAPELELKVVGLRSNAARKATDEKHAKMRKRNRGKALTSEQLVQCTKEVLHEVVLKDWRGIKDGGKPVPYDRALAKQWIESRNGEVFTDLVLEAAQYLDRESSEFVEEVTKNS